MFEPTELSMEREWWSPAAERWAGVFSSAVQKVQKQVRCPVRPAVISLCVVSVLFLVESPWK